MRSKFRFATLGLLVPGALALVAAGIAALVIDPARLDQGGGGSAMRRGLLLVLSHPEAHAYAGMAIVLGGLALALAVMIRRSPARWPLVPVPIVGGYLVIMVWRGRDWVAHLEPVGYRARSSYVQAATRLATVGAIYLVALSVVAIAAWFASRPPPSSSPPAPLA